jgi:hypothetical protein
VSDPVSSGLASAGSSGFGSSRGGFGSSGGGTPTEVGTPTDFEEYGGGGSYGFGEPTRRSEITTTSTTTDTTPDTTPEITPDQTPDRTPEIVPPEWDNREYEENERTSPERFNNAIANPYDGFFF